MDFATILPYYDPSRTYYSVTGSYSFQPTSAQMNIDLPFFSTDGPTSAFDLVSVDPNSMGQVFYYPPNMPPSMLYPAAPVVQTPPTTAHARHIFDLMVDPERTLPVQLDPMDNDASYGAKSAPFTSGSTRGGGINSTTNEDILMPAIQARRTDSSQSLESKV
jgi:hypothetical protein